jgi:hypothetical protein
MERPQLYGLAAAGAVGGAWKYYVRPELTATRGWAAIGLGVLAYELACPQGELLSEGVDRALDRNRPLTVAAVGLTALHLLNALPDKADPFKRGLDLLRKR